MIRKFGVLLIALLAVAANLPGAGFVTRENFVIVVPDSTGTDAQEFAQRLNDRAEFYRRLIARDWLGDELPDSVGRTVIHVDFSDTKDTGLTWAKDDPQRSFHNVYLNTSVDRALSSTLAHEIAHVVLATECPHPERLAAWIEEGIASRYDDPQRHAGREKILAWFARTGNWPSLERLLDQRTISTNEQDDYAVAASLVEFLVERRGRHSVVPFGQEAQQLGWGPALRAHYNIDHVYQLQTLWQTAIRNQLAGKTPQVAAVK